MILFISCWLLSGICNAICDLIMFKDFFKKMNIFGRKWHYDSWKLPKFLGISNIDAWHVNKWLSYLLIGVSIMFSKITLIYPILGILFFIIGFNITYYVSSYLLRQKQ